MNLKLPIAVFVLGALAALFFAGPHQALAVIILAVLEVSLSFDNAIINAKVLSRMNAFWQEMFLTVGMVVAVFGMRLLFPIIIVAASARLSFGSVIDLAWHHPEAYGHALEHAHPAIAAFGGMFLLMVFLDFLIDEGKRVHWLGVIERPLVWLGRFRGPSVAIALLSLWGVSATWAGSDEKTVLVAGLSGLLTYLAVRGLAQTFERLSGARTSDGKVAGRPALFLFIYLEVLDASFSFDGVVGAFAISNNVLVIAFGLGIGALFIRELTVWFVRRNTLSEFIYLEHGAHYAVGALAVLLAVSLAYDVPDVVTGLIGAGFIGWALGSSLAVRKKERQKRA